MAVDNEHAGAVLSKIFERGVASDQITLIPGADGRSVPIHRVILMANSEYFTASLKPNFAESNENEFIFDETDGSMLKAIVDFCYTGRIDLTKQNASKYLAIASGVEMHLLESKCWHFLEEKLRLNNAVATLITADKYSDHELRQKALNLVCEFFDKLPSTHIDELDYRLWEEVLKSDAVRGEEQFILERLLNWFRIDQDKRGQHMSELLKLIRLPLIPGQYLKANTMQTMYKEFDSFEYLSAEYKRRIACPTSTVGTRRHCSIFCLSKLYKGDAGAEQSAVKIERYNGVLNGFGKAGEIKIGDREEFGMILRENKVYILGGTIDGVDQKSVSVFDLNSGEERVLPEFISARRDFASLLFGKFIYVCGGQSGSSPCTYMNDCQRFDLETETWETMKPMATARCNSSVTVINESFCIAGGYNEQPGFLESVELFDPQNNEWTTLPAMNDARDDFALIISEGYLYAIGYSASVERYDAWKNRWTEIESPEDHSDFSSSVVIDDIIYLIRSDGGFGEMKINETDGCSFITLATCNFKSEYNQRHHLFRN